MTGGYSADSGQWAVDLKTTEFIDQNGSTPGKDLPYSFAYHCMSYMNTTHSILIGGRVDGSISSNFGKSVIVQMSDFKMTDGPVLNSNKRDSVACGNFQHSNGTKYIILAGGGYVKTTQLLNVDSVNEGWHSGMKFMQPITV